MCPALEFIYLFIYFILLFYLFILFSLFIFKLMESEVNEALSFFFLKILSPYFESKEMANNTVH